jgi:hypothetical protein
MAIGRPRALLDSAASDFGDRAECRHRNLNLTIQPLQRSSRTQVRRCGACRAPISNGQPHQIDVRLFGNQQPGEIEEDVQSITLSRGKPLLHQV